MEELAFNVIKKKNCHLICRKISNGTLVIAAALNKCWPDWFYNCSEIRKCTALINVIENLKNKISNGISL